MNKKDLTWLHALHLAHYSNLGSVRQIIKEYGVTAAAHQYGIKQVVPPEAWRELEVIKETEGVWLLTPDQPTYPKLLASSPDAPELIYGKGNSAALSHPLMVSIVGSRKCTAYGLSVVNEIVPELVRAGFVTVSGLAFGIDAAVHRATLAAGGRTIAVLGGSVTEKELAPRAHTKLALEILSAKGAIISEYPPGTITYPKLYPERNRIVAGLSLATIVIEGAERSGSLITARLATEAGRSVLAVPGSIFARTSSGTNQLISTGATPLLSCQSLFDEIECHLKDISIDYIANVVTTSIDPVAAIILKECSVARTLDQIIESTELTSAVVLQMTTQLCLSGQLSLDENNRYLNTRAT
ncbi:MAG: DNA-protecting protein DprA [Candidatus Kerfeldbacteria bacterium CG15_BIG_FIL_POST_REV_8_21_14_020_45_12]|uniref:DNA-protecting protein DprA n=1 Tax=Candidatus Kerfeldbacteria bacterium CG15_BIG_FIL_POST_REV_8_21_14_020_45_12 TaxID=2014247 RepID=A0A2M7H2D1_9BACT|nr:MAG: DNA-protecting protein DprA [Candidatus Kerfeldbacteria bacterium CG15_BIG_FIL_POST_REV_8_21_14_020_45_12]PJA93697.1 MAG: DNA-protecting protein DprA [Candidatus Kerfeldbacteria bacterium CG_4_9_14_3_um_filter_45_8]